jgi:SAM-dependent methyltransferase
VAAVPIHPKSVLFRFSPLARKLLPKWALRFLLLTVLQTNRRYAGMYEAASRLCLERELLPWLAQHYGRVLFVGTSSYTRHYEKQFRRDQYTTIDVQPRNAVWGAANHIVAPIEEIGRHLPAGSFDCIVLNGVFGFGVDDPDHMRRVIAALHTALGPQGFLVVGWNTNLHADPAPLLAPCFVANTREPWVQRRTFPLETHVYDFFLRRAGQ